MTKASIFNTIFPCFLAGCLEMYDFVLFGFLADKMHINYFSFLSGTSALIVTYVLFAVGFVCRPLGAAIFGHIGDKYGRKKALVLSVSLMGTASLSMALLPSYDQIGIISCYAIALIRIIQGISVGGEYSGAAIYSIEHIKSFRKGLVGSTVLAGTTLGVLLATCVSDLLKSESLPDYSWRFAFLLGGGLSIIGYFIRRRCFETPEFLDTQNARYEVKAQSPLLEGIKMFPGKFIAGIFLSGANNANYYFALVFVPLYLQKDAVQTIDFSNWYLAFFMLLLEPIFGFFSDKIGRKKMLWFVFCALAIFNCIFLDMMRILSGTNLMIFLVIIAAILISISVSTVNITVLEIFPVRYRYSLGAVSYSLGAAIFGGTTPLVCTLIQKYIGNEPYYFGCYVSLISLLGLVAMKIMEHGSHQRTSLDFVSSDYELVK